MDSVTICNLALMMVGIPAITSFDDSNNNARLCKEFFPVLRDRVLRDHTWSFAVASCDLQQLDERCIDRDFQFVCALPGDAIRVINLDDDSPYRRIGNRILVRKLPARVMYIKRVEDSNLFDETFVEALQYLIAAEIGMANTRDAQLINLFTQKYQLALATARSIDSQENRFAYQNNPQRSSWLAARR
jgi:hypothetical protein